MEFKTTFTKARKRAFTLVELMIGTGIATMAMAILGVSTSMMLTSFDSMSNYIELEQQSRLTLDKMSREIRSSARAVYTQPHGFIVQLEEGPTVVDCAYYYYNGTSTLYRLDYALDTSTANTTNPGTFSYQGKYEIVLKNLDLLTFSYFQRNPENGTYNQHPAASWSTCKLIQLSWTCSLENFVGTQNTELVQSAKFVIRKQ